MAGAYNKDKILLFKKLCCSLQKDKTDNLQAVFQRGLESLTSFDEVEFQTSFSPWEEYQINESIENLIREKYPNSEGAISRFKALSRSLQDISDEADCYAEQLLFLLRLSEQNHSSRFELPNTENEINGNVTSFNVTAESLNETNFFSTNWNTNSSLPPEATNSSVIQREATNISSRSNGLGSSARSEENKVSISTEAPGRKLLTTETFDSPVLKNFPTHHLFTDTPIAEPSATSSRKGSSNKSNCSMRKHIDSVSSLEGAEFSRPNVLSVSRRCNSKDTNISDNEASEREIMKELVFCMQGIEGKIIKYKSVDEGFFLNPQIKIDQPYLVLHLMELGFLHNQIKQFTSTLFVDSGTVAQGLLNAIRREISEYYQAIATLDSQLNPTPEIADTPLSEEECAKLKLPSLSQIFVWSRDPLLKLQTLLDVLSAVQNKRGGEIISDLAFFSYHGNPKVKKIVTRLLASAIQPFYKQIFYWVVNGEIIDSRGEFFVQMENPGENIDAWHKHYVLRPAMIPKYMSLEEANQILETGRCMNFLHNICRQRPAHTPAQVTLSELDKNKWNDPASLIKPGNDVSELISKAYKEVSKNVLNTLNENFKMQNHFEALRKYMLLGQGDFIHYLLEIIEPDLNKCVAALHTYTLMRSVEDAVFKSNAQFDDSDVLNKLCVKMLVTSEQENVSEAFCLQYRLDGPLNTIFKCSSVGYNRMFTFLWRVKRANYMVLKMWRGLKLLNKEVNRLIPEARPVFTKANFLVMEMVNFIGHFQYYIASEVVEVSWRKFRSELEKMESLEKVLQSHCEFLESMQSSCMLNTKPGSTQATMAWHVRSLLDYVQELVPIVEMFQSLVETELDRRRTRQETIASVGVSIQSELENGTSTQKFSEEMNKVKAKFKVLANQYQEKLKSLLVLFSENQEEHNLILLSHRIDFNEFYKQNDSRLSETLKLHKRF